MRSKYKSICRGCGKACNSVFGKGMDLCRVCHNQSEEVHRIPMGAMKFDTELSVKTGHGDIDMTEEQAEFVDKRLNELYPNRRKDHRFAKLSGYLRGLVIEDFERHQTEVKYGETINKFI